MSAHKCVVILGFVVAAFLAINAVPGDAVGDYAAPNKSNHLIVGSRQPGDRLVLKQNVIKGSSWMKVQTIQKTFNTTNRYRITMVRALDQNIKGNGANASLLGGGPGFSNVTLKFKSKRGHSINFVVELYARF